MLDRLPNQAHQYDDTLILLKIAKTSMTSADGQKWNTIIKIQTDTH